MTVTVWVTVVGSKPVHRTSMCCVYTLAEAMAKKTEKAGMLENFMVAKMKDVE